MVKWLSIFSWFWIKQKVEDLFLTPISRNMNRFLTPRYHTKQSSIIIVHDLEYVIHLCSFILSLDLWWPDSTSRALFMTRHEKPTYPEKLYLYLDGPGMLPSNAMALDDSDQALNWWNGAIW